MPYSNKGQKKPGVNVTLEGVTLGNWPHILHKNLKAGEDGGYECPIWIKKGTEQEKQLLKALGEAADLGYKIGDINLEKPELLHNRTDSEGNYGVSIVYDGAKPTPQGSEFPEEAKDYLVVRATSKFPPRSATKWVKTKDGEMKRVDATDDDFIMGNLINVSLALKSFGRLGEYRNGGITVYCNHILKQGEGWATTSDPFAQVAPPDDAPFEDAAVPPAPEDDGSEAAYYESLQGAAQTDDWDEFDMDFKPIPDDDDDWQI